MLEGRKSGVLCHITSIPNEYGIGDFGANAFDFVDFLEKADQSYWQILPLTEPGATYSPYQSMSIFGINPIFLSIESLYENSFISKDLLENLQIDKSQKVDYAHVLNEKRKIILHAVERFIALGGDKTDDYRSFLQEQKIWLKDYALFMVISAFYNGKPWNEWDPALANLDEKALDAFVKEHEFQLKAFCICQFWLYYQWAKLKRYANGKGIKIIGDLPMYPDYNSVPVWRYKSLFLLDKKNNPAYVAGVPPDYFSEDGQYWGNPFYNWKRLKETNFLYWDAVLSNALKKVDIVRLDHFRGFSESFKIKANPERCAKDGKWFKVPGKDIFDMIKKKYPDMPFIAEDLGDIDDKVLKLRDKYNLPGMSILQFAFDSYDSLYLPHNQKKNQVLYTGTHDNNTVIGWWKSIDEEKRNFVRKYFSIDGNDINWQMIQAAARTSANTIIIPIQDILGLDEKYRMNTPGTVSDDNWSFRFSWDMVSDYCIDRLKEITNLYCRK